jgi:hypothetical protein
MVRLSRRVGEAALVFRGTSTAEPINDVLNGLFGMTELREPITPDYVCYCVSHRDEVRLQ